MYMRFWFVTLNETLHMFTRVFFLLAGLSIYQGHEADIGILYNDSEEAQSETDED